MTQTQTRTQAQRQIPLASCQKPFRDCYCRVCFHALSNSDEDQNAANALSRHNDVRCGGNGHRRPARRPTNQHFDR